MSYSDREIYRETSKYNIETWIRECMRYNRHIILRIIWTEEHSNQRFGPFLLEKPYHSDELLEHWDNEHKYIGVDYMKYSEKDIHKSMKSYKVQDYNDMIYGEYLEDHLLLEGDDWDWKPKPKPLENDGIPLHFDPNQRRKEWDPLYNTLTIHKLHQHMIEKQYYLRGTLDLYKPIDDSVRDYYVVKHIEVHNFNINGIEHIINHYQNRLNEPDDLPF